MYNCMHIKAGLWLEFNMFGTEQILALIIADLQWSVNFAIQSFAMNTHGKNGRVLPQGYSYHHVTIPRGNGLPFFLWDTLLDLPNTKPLYSNQFAELWISIPPDLTLCHASGFDPVGFMSFDLDEKIFSRTNWNIQLTKAVILISIRDHRSVID